VSNEHLLPAEPKRLLVAGDSHGNLLHSRFLFECAAENACDAILHLGDFGYWPKMEALPFLRFNWINSDRNQLPIYFVEGNHEDYPRLLGRDYPQIGSFRLIAPPKESSNAGIWHIPRGARWTWQGIRFLGVGGAYSIDKGLREQGVDWFPEETLTDVQVAAIISAEHQADICVFHDAPTGAPLPIDLFPNLDAAWNREQLAKIVKRVDPALIMHGHYHCAYQGRWRDEDSGASAAIVGLDSDENPAQSWLVLDLTQTREQLGDWRSGGVPVLLP
jgi:predicted phosphodiesterase